MSSPLKDESSKNDIHLNAISQYNNPSFKDEESDFSDNLPGSPTETPFIYSEANPDITAQVDYDDIVVANSLIDKLNQSDLEVSNPVINGNHSNQEKGDGIRPPDYSAAVDNIAYLPNTSVNLDEDSENVIGGDLTHSELILKIRKTIPLKNFKDEVRGHRDIQRFLVNPVVALNVTHTKLYLIVDEMLKKLQKDLDVSEKITSQAAKAFFTFQDEYQDSFVSVNQLRETIQGVVYRPEQADFEQTWVTAVCSLPNLEKSHVAIARLCNPVNLGTDCEEVKFVVVVIAPTKEKFTKNAVEIGRTFSSLLCDSDFRVLLQNANDENEVKEAFTQYHNKFKKMKIESKSDLEDQNSHEEPAGVDFQSYSWKQCGMGIYDDLKRRLPHYVSDYTDGLTGKNTISKLLATVFFLYFACLLPDIAFGTLYEQFTEGKIDVSSCILSQTIGGLLFAIFSGQPLLIMLTTAPLALYVKVIKMVSLQFTLDFSAMYTMVGIWNAIFLLLEAFFNLSQLMKFSTRSTEEIFGFFIALAFCSDAIKGTISNFKKNYHFPPTNVTEAATFVNYTEGCSETGLCYRPENSLLFLVLMLGTLWLGYTLLKFDQSPYLSARKREILADYALPISVIFFSFLGSYVFRQIKSEQFYYDPNKGISFKVPSISSLSIGAHFGAMGLGLCLSCLFFVDQNVSAAFVNAPQNKLHKGPAYHWDLVVVAIINTFLSIFNLPWVHAALPHSPLHVRALADVEQHVTNLGTVHDEIVKVRETRLSAIISHILIGVSLLFVHILQFIPISVLQGLFLYLGFSSFIGNQMFERMMLFFTEESSYPPTHYVRKVPQRTVHFFTLTQMVQLGVVSFFGFADYYYLKMIFPVIILLLLPIRHLLLPKLFDEKYLKVLDY